MKIKLIRFKDNITMPTRKHYNDAGIDCYCPKKTLIVPDRTVKIDLGFGLEVPDGYVAIIKPRSSMNCTGIITHEGVIDSGYRGEISAVFSNHTNGLMQFEKGDRICQIIVVPCIIFDLAEDLGEERQNDGFGSSGK